MAESLVQQTGEEILSWPMEGKRILWFSEVNKYLIAAIPADYVIKLIWQGAEAASVHSFCENEMEMDISKRRILILKSGKS